ncbi:MAG: ABC transporter ATP-binding protein [Deltaproteobacteria bacterium]|uniref:ABC transporter ATP-binding protein n=1 Tax=Candidatus Desulfacyla euxinica TaxID=2841693 RepID=A0A8J6T6N5_9DELT|nr:ABC transporter ATP-binding protein [Candidatus Desulfacyla euxinica]MBL7217923.1 ABC transporter ATP-binding protein [Desulfobacteraceae bacterium]
MVATNQKSEVVFKDVAKGAYSKKLHTVILKDCSLNVEAGKLTVLIGPSGCGKTTVINLIAGYERPDHGEVLMDGQPVSGPNWERLVVFQETALFPWLTCYENVMFGPTARKSISREEAHRETMMLLNKVGLSEFRDKYPVQLSGGMQRRAELARALINKPKVMLMDEPFRGLDAMTRKLMQEYYLRLFEETGCTNLFVTSELEEAIILADKLLVMTNKPSKVRKAIDVDLPRPRDWSIATSERYREIKAEALELLHAEAIKGSVASGKTEIDLKAGFEKLKTARG